VKPEENNGSHREKREKINVEEIENQNL